MPHRLSELLNSGASRLAPYSDSPRLDAQVLLAHVARQSRTWVLAHADEMTTDAQADALGALIDCVKRGDPLPYVIGHHEFFGLDFDISPDVLIPRPETEMLVGRAVEWLSRAPARRSVADIGTGSGCIGISIAANVPDARVLATDISGAALNVARRNARKFGVDARIQFVECDILPTTLPGPGSVEKFDVLCANLPYIPTETLRSLPVFRREPTLALDGGPDGLVPFRRFFAAAPHWMAPGGLMLLEIEDRSGPAVLSLAYDAFHAAAIHLSKDFADRDRLLEIQLNGLV